MTPTAASHNALVRRGHARIDELIDRLSSILEPILNRAADDAARAFEENATALTASLALRAAAPSSNSTMICVMPREDEAAALAVPGGDPGDVLHVTLCFLGEVEGSLTELADTLRPVAARIGPLAGKVAGAGEFAGEESGSPKILLPSVPGLVELRNAVTEALAHEQVDYSREYGYVPHMTSEYGPSGQLPDRTDVYGHPLHFDSLWIVRGDNDYVEIPLVGAKPLTASGGPSGLAPAPVYDLTHGTEIEVRFMHAADAAGFDERQTASWPHEGTLALQPTDNVLFRDAEGSALLRLPGGTLVAIEVHRGELRSWVAAASRGAVNTVLHAMQHRWPFTQLAATDERIPITFWTYTPFGAQSRLRMIASQPWSAIEQNYPAAVREPLADLMTSFEPGKNGQLLLWQGPPGTGKTWALRALASEWLPWAEFHYITDPDRFFVDEPSYMIDVLLAEQQQAVRDPGGDVYDQEPDEGKWRVLILEDTGELLAADARDKAGQGLSRLLNVVDGMIGQGLRVLCLVTTNDELGELNPAVRRPGRCASQIEFHPLTPEEAAEWLGDESDGPLTLAELYARRGQESASGEDLEDDPTVTAIRDVSAAHQEEQVGYGETAWNAEEGVVLYVSGDWTDPDPIDADYLAIEGVNEVRHEAEALPEGWWDAEVVYPDPPPRWVVEQSLAAASPPAGWAAPTPDEIVDVDALVSKLRTKTDPVRLALIKNMMGEALGEPGVTLDEALAYYHSPKAFELNDKLRSGKALTAEEKAIVNTLDAAMAVSEAPMTLYRGVPNFPDVLGKTAVKDIEGLQYETKGYLSMSAQHEVAEQFAGGAAGPGDRPLVMQVNVPKGTPMLRVPAGDYGDQDEWLLPRETRVALGGTRVVEDGFGERTVEVNSTAVSKGVLSTSMAGVARGAGIAWDASNPFAAKVLEQSGSQIVEIAKTTRLNVMRIIRRSHEEGLTIPDTAKAIRAGMRDASPARATLIARTEMTGAVNGGSLASVQLIAGITGDVMFKQWLTAEGAVFPRHEEYDGLDGQTVRLDDPFDVGGFPLQFPGDPDGPPEEVCNCRCAVAYTEDASELTAPD